MFRLTAVISNARAFYIPSTFASNGRLFTSGSSKNTHNGFFADDDYHLLLKLSKEKLSKALVSPTRFQSIEEREDRSDIPATFNFYEFKKYQAKYRGTLMLKGFLDSAIYYQLFNHVKPKTVIEMGSFTGASAMFYADAAKSLGYDCLVYSIEINPSVWSKEIMQQKPDTVTFIEGDTNKIDEVLPPSLLQPLPHPWLVVDDAHENMTKVVSYLNRFMIAGDYMVLEDTNPNLPSAIKIDKIEDEGFQPWGSDKLNALKNFLKGPIGKDFKVDSFFTDFYGYNCTWHWHGFLKKF